MTTAQTTASDLRIGDVITTGSDFRDPITRIERTAKTVKVYTDRHSFPQRFGKTSLVSILPR